MELNLLFILIFLFVFLSLVYARTLGLAFVVLLIGTAYSIYIVEERRLEKCKQNCKYN